MAAASAPSNIARVAALFLAFAFGVVALALNADALKKGNNEKDRVASLVPKGTDVSIDTSDVVSAGAAVAAFGAALALASLIFFVAALVPTRSVPTKRMFYLQTIILAVCSIGLVVGSAVMTNFVATRQAKVSASISGFPVPDAIVQSIEQSIGATSVYHQISYLKVAAILPWIAFLFGAIASVLTLLVAASTIPHDGPAAQVDRDTDSVLSGADYMKEKSKVQTTSI